MCFNVLVGLHIQVLIVLLVVAFLSMYVKRHVYAACKIVSVLKGYLDVNS
jgi:hypothetical protein